MQVVATEIAFVVFSTALAVCGAAPAGENVRYSPAPVGHNDILAHHFILYLF